MFILPATGIFVLWVLYVAIKDFKPIAPTAGLITLVYALAIERNGIINGAWYYTVNHPTLFDISIGVIITYFCAGFLFAYYAVKLYTGPEQEVKHFNQYLGAGALIIIISVFISPASQSLGILLIASTYLRRYGTEPLLKLGLIAAFGDFLYENGAILFGELTYNNPAHVIGVPAGISIVFFLGVIALSGFSIQLDKKLFSK